MMATSMWTAKRTHGDVVDVVTTLTAQNSAAIEIAEVTLADAMAAD